jgi:RND family efflux transporter MFP subunit
VTKLTGAAGNWLFALLILAGGSVASYFLLVGKPRPEPAAVLEAPAPQVDVMVARPAERALSVRTQGSVRPLRQIKLIARVGGRIEETAPDFADGGFFRAGEPLLKIEDVDYRLAIARAEAGVAAARQRVAEEKGRALQARREWRDLGSEDANALFLRQPQLAAAEADLGAALAALASARLDMERTAVLAPFNGRISTKLVDAGQYVTPGTVLAEAYDTDVAQVRLPLTDRQVALLDLPLSYDNEARKEDAGVAVTLRARFAAKDWEWPARIVRTDASIDVDSRVVYAVAEVERPFSREPGSERPPLSPGLFVHAEISGRLIEGVTSLPRSALRSDGTVMLVDGGQRARPREVVVLHSTPREVWLQGLDEGERVIVAESVPTLAGSEVSVKVLGNLADVSF